MYICNMRTTITIDDDIAVRLHTIQRESDQSFKAVVNSVLRKGLMAKDQKTERTFDTPTLTIGTCRYPDIDNIADLLEAAEHKDYK